MYNPELIKHLDDWRNIPKYRTFKKRVKTREEQIIDLKVNIEFKYLEYRERMVH